LAKIEFGAGWNAAADFVSRKISAEFVPKVLKKSGSAFSEIRE